jgi:hypothetical protein
VNISHRLRLVVIFSFIYHGKNIFYSNVVELIRIKSKVTKEKKIHENSEHEKEFTQMFFQILILLIDLVYTSDKIGFSKATNQCSVYETDACRAGF